MGEGVLHGGPLSSLISNMFWLSFELHINKAGNGNSGLTHPNV